jgi:hypothetical protein
LASTGANGALASVTGTIYAANNTFDFDSSGLYGNGLAFLSQSG